MLNLFEGRGFEETLHFIEEKVHAGLWSWNLHTGEMKWSDGHFALFGIEPSVEMTYERQMALVHPEDRPGLRELEAVLGEGLPFAREYRVIQATGRMRWLAMRGEPLLDAHGKAHRAVGLTLDITERHEAQQGAIRDARFRTIMRGIAPLVWSARPDGTLIDLLGSLDPVGSHDVDVGENGWLDAVHPDDHSATMQAWTQAVVSRELFEIEHRLRLRDGTYRLFHTSGRPRPGAGGVAWQGVCIDMGARKPKDPHHHVITGAQVRAARGILKWSVGDLAVAANVSPAIIRRIEDFDGTPARSDTAADSLRQALVDGGVEFLYPVDGRPGIRPAPSRSELHRPAAHSRAPVRAASAAMRCKSAASMTNAGAK